MKYIIDDKTRDKIFKSIVCVLFTITIVAFCFKDGLNPYFKEKIYDYQNDFTEAEANSVDFSLPIEQHFVSKGNHLFDIRIYIVKKMLKMQRLELCYLI